MAALSTSIRNKLEEAVKQARRVAEIAARSALDALAVQEAAPYPHMDELAKRLRNHLRARARQLGDVQTPDKKIRLDRIVHECAYEHWHRMLFARFLAENHLLVEPDPAPGAGPTVGVAISLDECKELAAAEKTDLWAYASRLAQRMLPSIFRPSDPLLQVTFAREHRVKLEGILAGLDLPVFTADDALGWVYQFWRAEEKDAVNKAGDKINADTLPAVTQLFTEHYMVEFLLHNTLGAWWTAKNEAAKRTSAIPLPYLRRKEDGSPAAGAFLGWPKTVRELRAIDPCCGSGHILVAILQLLMAMRREEEGLSAEAAVRAVLTENLHGLEIDARCSQLAAFNVAFAAWKLIGRPVELPSLHIACSGLAVGGTKEEWLQAVESTGSELRFFLGQLYDLFKKAPDLGSLINPARLIGRSMHADKLEPLLKMLDTAFAREDAVKRTLAPEEFERGVTAQGLARAAQLLSGRYHLTVTNVPYLARGKQDELLRDFIETHYPAGKADLATAFVLRCLEFCAEAGTVALVTPQNWLFLGSYKKLREQLLEHVEWEIIARLGEHGFDSPAAAGAFVAMFALTRISPSLTHEIAGLDVAEEKDPDAKDVALRDKPVVFVSQHGQTKKPDARISLDTHSDEPPLSDYCASFLGLGTGDYPHYGRCFWEFPGETEGWAFQQGTVETPQAWGGREHVLAWDSKIGRVRGMSQAEREQIHNQDQSGQQAWGKKGVAVGLMRELKPTLYSGEVHEKALAALIPHKEDLLPAIWAFCSSPEFNTAVRKLDHNIIVANGTLVKVPFDLDHWQEVAAEKFPHGLPEPRSDDPSQWLFSGHPRGATEPLQVAVARLLGYQWPRQTGSEFPDSPALGPDGLEALADEDGIVCLSAIHGEAAAADRLQRILAAAYGSKWSSAELESLLSAAGYGHKTLDDWLRDKFFEQHCALFHQRPFIWQIWDGLPRGFSALVNYHRLTAPSGAGRKLLEKLTYTYLGDWISRQNEGVRNGTAGADDRLAAALELKQRLVAILTGEPPFDLFARWKPLHQQPIGWEPDVNDGVRVNIRPFMASDLPNGKRDAGILRNKPNVKWEKDRGKEPRRLLKEFPWFWDWDEETVDFPGGDKFTGDRWNACHYTTKAKHAARTSNPPK